MRVQETEAGCRLDLFLAGKYPEIARSRLKRAILSGHVQVNASGARPARRLRAGDAVRVDLPPEPEPGRPRPEEIPLEVVFEDDHLLVVNKAAGMVVHPAGTVREGTLVNALLGRGVSLSALGGPERPGIVHRLDKGTSGLMLVAKRDESHAALTGALRRRGIRREYWAVVWGRPFPVVGTIAVPLGRDERRRTRMAVRRVGGREAATDYRVTRSFDWASEIWLRLHTGRTHQIRVHLSHWGHPVLGDPTYGGRRPPAGLAPRERRSARALVGELGRPALHAARLTFSHPVTGREMSFAAPLPPELERVVSHLERGRDK